MESSSVTKIPLRAHQREAVDAVLRALELAPGAGIPARGLRTQVIMATGSGKTYVAARSADELGAGRVLVLVPSLDLLTQTEQAWRDSGRTGPVIGVSSLRGDEASFPNTTDADELVEWTRHLDRVTVFATYASLGLGTLERAHQVGLSGWDLIVVDEAHRVSGRIGKPWAVVHDNQRIPAARRLYMTATPRVWQLDEDNPGQPGELVASMEDDPDGPFGSRAYTLTLSDAVSWGICARYQVVCVDVTDTEYQDTLRPGSTATTEEVRGARIAALQTALVKASAEEGFKRTLTFHHLVKEAEAFITGLPDVVARLHKDDPELYPNTIWADWLSGEHSPLQRARVLDEFATGIAGDGTVVEKSYLGSVKVLGEGVDTRDCDSVYFADVRGSMPDLVQAVGRALRMKPGEGKTASLVVPILFKPGESAHNMLTSKAYGDLAKLLVALRAHDARVIEVLSQAPSPIRPEPTGADEGDDVETELGDADDGEGPSAGARELLKFSTPRDPAVLAAFIQLRILDPEHERWRRGIEASVLYAGQHGGLRVPFTFRVPGSSQYDDLDTVQDAVGEKGWPTSLAEFPLGQWIADARRQYARGTMSEGRIDQLEKLGMIWSTVDVAWEKGLSAARAWAELHGHLLAPLDATFEGAKVGIFLKNARAAARRADDNQKREAEGLPADTTGWVLSEERREQLEEIDASWCPAWPVTWQRTFHLTRLHLEAGEPLPTRPGQALAQGEDLGRWVQTVRTGWGKLTGAQQWMCAHVLGIEPAEEAEKPKPSMNQAQKWAMHLAAARQFFEREGHLKVPRKHIETISAPGADHGHDEERPLKLGAWVANQRSRAATLTSERVEQLSAVGMRWT
ncbi:Helicase associated domain protein [Streptomyces sp. NBC_01174]|uniref:DEAD/DEAH box helicase n=1 Tax=Streptomyces sp. NBC_01174 TaxID=2903758 RepID=UPI002F9155EF|nr:Helicase associated domain protein [Streptomyces sp. NBC_01174]